MEGIVRNSVVRVAVGVLAVAASLASGFFLVLMPALTVPTPWSYLFYAGWFGTVLLTIVVAARRPWLSLAVPIAVSIAALGLLYLGDVLLGWGG